LLFSLSLSRSVREQTTEPFIRGVKEPTSPWDPEKKRAGLFLVGKEAIFFMTQLSLCLASHFLPPFRTTPGLVPAFIPADDNEKSEEKENESASESSPDAVKQPPHVVQTVLAGEGFCLAVTSRGQVLPLFAYSFRPCSKLLSRG